MDLKNFRPRLGEDRSLLKDKILRIGLAITQGIIQEHGGKIKVNSTTGEGTEFIIELPAKI